MIFRRFHLLIWTIRISLSIQPFYFHYFLACYGFYWDFSPLLLRKLGLDQDLFLCFCCGPVNPFETLYVILGYKNKLDLTCGTCDLNDITLVDRRSLWKAGQATVRLNERISSHFLGVGVTSVSPLSLRKSGISGMNCRVILRLAFWCFSTTEGGNWY